jgi:hypothetical protein
VRRAALVPVLVALALAGCGRSGARADVQRVAEGFYADVRARDGARACALLSEDARQALEQQESKRCARAVEELQLSGSRAKVVRVYSTQGAVELARGDTVFLEATPRGWRIAAAGCRPGEHGKPADCEVAA